MRSIESLWSRGWSISRAPNQKICASSPLLQGTWKQARQWLSLQQNPRQKSCSLTLIQFQWREPAAQRCRSASRGWRGKLVVLAWSICLSLVGSLGYDLLQIFMEFQEWIKTRMKGWPTNVATSIQYGFWLPRVQAFQNFCILIDAGLNNGPVTQTLLKWSRA